MTPVTSAARGLEKCGLEPTAAVQIAAKALQELRNDYVVLPRGMPELVADILRRKGFSEAGAQATYKSILLGSV